MVANRRRAIRLKPLGEPSNILGKKLSTGKFLETEASFGSHLAREEKTTSTQPFDRARENGRRDQGGREGGRGRGAFTSEKRGEWYPQIDMAAEPPAVAAATGGSKGQDGLLVSFDFFLILFVNLYSHNLSPRHLIYVCFAPEI